MITLPQLIERKPGDRCCDREARPQLPTRKAEALTADLSILAHPVRLQLLDMLVRNEGRVCVCDLEEAVPVKQPTVSHHLKLLKQAGLVNSERQGLWAYYFVNREALDALRTRIGEGLKALG